MGCGPADEDDSPKGENATKESDKPKGKTLGDYINAVTPLICVILIAAYVKNLRSYK